MGFLVVQLRVRLADRNQYVASLGEQIYLEKHSFDVRPPAVADLSTDDSVFASLGGS